MKYTRERRGLCCSLEKGITVYRKFEFWYVSLEIKIIVYYFINNNAIFNHFQPHLVSFVCKLIGDRREQTTPVINKILDDLKKKANWKQQCSFLLKCKDSKVVPKGLRVNVPKGIMNREQEKKWKIKCEVELLQKRIKRLYIKQ